MELLFFVRTFLIIVFLSSAILKLISKLSFKNTLQELGIPANLQTTTAWVVPFTEILISILLIFPFSSMTAEVGIFVPLSIE